MDFIIALLQYFAKFNKKFFNIYFLGRDPKKLIRASLKVSLIILLLIFYYKGTLQTEGYKDTIGTGQIGERDEFLKK